MPYIASKRRQELEPLPPIYQNLEAGELNFLLSQVIKRYIRQKGISYQTWSDVDAALGLLQFEIRRRHIAPYEDQKQLENGDVF